jgi:hypothetical protein
VECLHPVAGVGSMWPEVGPAPKPLVGSTIEGALGCIYHRLQSGRGVDDFDPEDGKVDLP